MLDAIPYFLSQKAITPGAKHCWLETHSKPQTSTPTGLHPHRPPEAPG